MKYILAPIGYFLKYNKFAEVVDILHVKRCLIVLFTKVFFKTVLFLHINLKFGTLVDKKYVKEQMQNLKGAVSAILAYCKVCFIVFSTLEF